MLVNIYLYFFINKPPRLLSTSHSEIKYIFVYINRIGGTMITMLAMSAVDPVFKPQSGQIKYYKLVFVASPLSMQQ